MPAGVEHIPVVSVAPTVKWVSRGSRKPITEVAWSSETLQAEEIAAIGALGSPGVFAVLSLGSRVEHRLIPPCGSGCV
jgi:hypothetical protein